MAKDKSKKLAEKFLNDGKSLLHKVCLVFTKLVEKIIAIIDKIDPAENTKQRVISALVLLPVAIYAICFSQNLFFLLTIIVTILMTAEWLNLIKNSQDQKKWSLIGLAYIAIPMYCLIKLRMHDVNILLWMFSIIWVTDIFAFFSGKTFAGAKLAPNISPNKTWTGLAGGVFASVIIGFLSAFMFRGGIFFFVFFSAFLSIVEQASDLLESKFKRIFGVKDSGDLIPGHGGILDRLDGVMLVAPAVLFLVTVFSDKF
ncbi:MAG: phosphatidate cytidylyltransferase [Rickettsiales bacterium]|nr:phosphatidate cytidylyltransferase [Rickettsiales bacterium]